MSQEERNVVVDLEAAAVLLITNRLYRRGFELWAPGRQTLRRVRMAAYRSPVLVYRIFFRREEAEELLRWGEAFAGILVTFETEPDRTNGEILMRAASALKRGLARPPHA